MQANLVPTGQHSASNGHSPIVQFFVNVQILANKDKEQAAILFSMLFTLIIWVFSALSLALAVLFYVLYLWHHIRDGSLSRYCRRKIDTRLHKIVMKKVNKALAKDRDTRGNQGAKGPKAADFQADAKAQPTLPILDSENHAAISRQTTQTDTSSLDSRTLTDVTGPEPTVPNVYLESQRPDMPSRSVTQSSYRSDGSYGPNAPLLNSAGEMGYGGNGYPSRRGAPSRTDSDVRTLHSARPPPNWTLTGNTSFHSSKSPFGPPTRQNSDMSGRSIPTSVPSQSQFRKPMPRNISADTVARRPLSPQGFDRSTQEYEMHPPARRPNGPHSNGGYIAFNPYIQDTPPKESVSVYSKPSSAAPPSQLAPPLGAPTNYFEIDRPAPRSGTAPLPQATTLNTSPDDPYAGKWQQSFTRPVGPPRPATAGPNGYGQRRPMPPQY